MDNKVKFDNPSYPEKEFPSYPVDEAFVPSKPYEKGDVYDADPVRLATPRIIPIAIPVPLSGTTIVVQPTDEQARIAAVVKAQDDAKQAKADAVNAKAFAVDQRAVNAAVAADAKAKADKLVSDKKASDAKVAYSKAVKVVTNKDWDELIRALKSARIL